MQLKYFIIIGPYISKEITQNLDHYQACSIKEQCAVIEEGSLSLLKAKVTQFRGAINSNTKIIILAYGGECAEDPLMHCLNFSNEIEIPTYQFAYFLQTLANSNPIQLHLFSGFAGMARDHFISFNEDYPIKAGSILVAYSSEMLSLFDFGAVAFFKTLLDAPIASPFQTFLQTLLYAPSIGISFTLVLEQLTFSFKAHMSLQDIIHFPMEGLEEWYQQFNNYYKIVQESNYGTEWSAVDQPLIKKPITPEQGQHLQLVTMSNAAANGDLNIFQQWVKENPYDFEKLINIPFMGQTPLLAATRENEISLIRFLLEHKANPNIASSFSGATPLFFAADTEGSQETEAGKLLLQYNANPNTARFDGRTPLINAVISDSISMVHLLLAHNADANLATKKGSTALFIAVTNGKLDIASALLDYKADPNSITNGFTLLDFAVSNGSLDMVALLLKRGALPDVPYPLSATPLLQAIDKSHKEIVELLLHHGANPNRASKGGTIPLFIAVKKGKEEIVKLLLEHGADPNLPSIQGDTPIFMAIQEEKWDIGVILILAGADIHYQFCRASVCYTPYEFAFANHYFTSAVMIHTAIESQQKLTHIYPNIKPSTLWLADRYIASHSTAYKQEYDCDKGDSPIYSFFENNHAMLLCEPHPLHADEL